MTIDDLADQVAWLDQQLNDLRAQTTTPQLAKTLLPELELDTQVTLLMQADRPEQWCTDAAVRCLAAAWPDARKRLLLATAARKCGVTPAMLAGLVEQWQGEQGDDLDLTTISGTALLQTDYAQRQEVVEKILPAGCTLLAGNAKEGKSLLAYHLAACVATGQPFLQTFPVQQGQVLFFALEDGEMRGKARLAMQREQLGLTEEDLTGVAFRFWDAPRLGAGFERCVERWMTTQPATRLVIIDILEKIRPRGRFWHDLYQEGYQATAPLARMAQEMNIALLVVHHSTKNPHTDPRLRVSGPMSLLGGADNAWLLKRPYGEEEAELTIAGRDLREQELALRFREGLWTYEGPLQAHRLSRQRQEVLELLEEEPGGLRPWQLAQALGKNPSTVRSLLKKMRQDGEVVLEDGLYRRSPPEASPPPAVSAVAPVHAVAPVSAVGEPTPASGDAGDREDTDNTVDAGNRGDTGNAMDSADTGDVSNAGDARDSTNAVDVVHAPPEEEDPFLAPEAYPEVAEVIDDLSEEETSAQVSTPVQTSTSPPEDLPIKEGDWIWACLASGARTNTTPWQVVDIHHLPNGITMVYGQAPTGRLTPWRLEHCRRVEPEDTR